MNDTINSILERRSIRNYLPEQIKKEELDVILKCGIYAPSSNDEQDWHFTVIQDKTILDRISSKTKALMAESDSDWASSMGKDEKFHVFYNAPTVILVSGAGNSSSSIINCSAATENMMIAAQSLGIGSCWIGIVGLLFDCEEEMSILQIPEGYKPLYMVTLGYPDLEVKVTVPGKNMNVVSYL